MQVTGDTRTTDNWAATTTYTGIKIIPDLPEIQEEIEISVHLSRILRLKISRSILVKSNKRQYVTLTSCYQLEQLTIQRGSRK